MAASRGTTYRKILKLQPSSAVLFRSEKTVGVEGHVTVKFVDDGVTLFICIIYLKVLSIWVFVANSCS